MPSEEKDGEVEKIDGEDDDEVPAVVESTEPIQHDPFSVKVFTIAKESQATNGLRHNDHLRYRQYCTRRLRRIRNTLRWHNGRGRGKQVPFPSDFSDWRYLEFPLVCAERAWSYGVQLKSDNATAATWQPRWRLHSIRRFAKAVRWAEFLESVCKIHGDQRTQREAEAYTAFMAGTLLLEKEEWEQALAKFQRCRKVCEHLALASDQAESARFKAHANELAPAIRECKYNLGMGHDDADDADAATAKPGKGESKDLSGFAYRGHGLVSPPEKIKAQLLKCVQLAGAIKAGAGDESANVIEKYGELSAEFGDALKDIHADMIGAGDAETEGPSEAEWRLLEAFVRELSICMNVERNLVLLWNHLVKLDGLEEIGSQEARKTCRPEEGMRYCDLLKEDLQSLSELPETSSNISKALETYTAIALNCRCFFLALCHSLTGKTLESAALLDMLRSRLEDAELGAALEEPLGRLHPLFERVVTGMPTRVSQWRCRGLALLCSKAPKTKEQEAEGDANAPTFPPRVRDIPCKPLLFDLAFPCMEPPALEEFLPKGRSSQGGDGQKGPGILGGAKNIAGNIAGGLGSRIGGIFGRK
jgi:signal recognition particle subunit SRP68